MSYSEVQTVLFTSVRRDMSKEELDWIKADYAAILPIISRRELSGNKAVLISYPMEKSVC